MKWRKPWPRTGAIWRRWPPSEMLSAMLRRARFHSLAFLAVVTIAGCERRGGCAGAYCGTPGDAATAVFRFHERYPEMFYDAVYHMRILPAHLLRSVPREQWKTAPFGRQPLGDGPYRFVSWQAAQSLELVADSTFFLGRPAIR